MYSLYAIFRFAAKCEVFMDVYFHEIIIMMEYYYFIYWNQNYHYYYYELSEVLLVVDLINYYFK